MALPAARKPGLTPPEETENRITYPAMASVSAASFRLNERPVGMPGGAAEPKSVFRTVNPSCANRKRLP